MRFPIYQVDAFAESVFAGNPAAVVPLDRWPADSALQAIAAENNLSETAFLVPAGERWELRWFTPVVEVDLCGHATLATAFVLSERLAPGRDVYEFITRKSGTLAVTREDGLLSLDLPARARREAERDAAVLAALGVADPVETLSAYAYMVVLDTEAQVRALAPDMAALARVGWPGVIVTAPGLESDCASRYFAPARGIPEDPVTGSAHCALVPYWAARLGRDTLLARQVSARGGVLRCRLDGDRVHMAGGAVLYMEGTITV